MTNKEQQDLAWKCLPSETRGYIRALCMKFDDTGHLYQTMKTEFLEEVFGRHNIFSDTEPEEILMVEREKVISKYESAKNDQENAKGDSIKKAYGFGRKSLLKNLFGDKCLPDKETDYSKQRFRVHDKVMFNDNLCQIIGTDYDNKEFQLKRISDNHLMGWANESALEPYTEPESRNLSQEIANCDKSEDNQLKDNMEEKAYATGHATVPVFYTPDVKVDISKHVRDAYIAGATEALAGQWRSVEDELPDGTPFCVTMADEESRLCLCHFDGDVFIEDYSGLVCSVKYWMPIPFLPSKDGKPIIDPSTLTEEQREAIKDRYNYHNIPDGVIIHWEDRNTNLIVRYILTEIFGKSIFERGE